MIRQNWIMAKLVQNIRDYEITGTVKDNGWLYANKSLLEGHLLDDMRANNILPILDMPVNISCSYIEEDDIFQFSMIAAGYQMESSTEYLGILLKDGLIVSADAKKVFLYEGL